MAMARMMGGKASRPSVVRIIMVSVSLPKYPLTTPIGTPNTTAMAVEAKPTYSETRDPWMIRLKMSLPISSVPSQNCAVGNSKG